MPRRSPLRSGGVGDGPTDEQLQALLRVVADGDDADHPLDNQGIATALGISLDDVAERLTAALELRLVWGIRVGLLPRPRYEDLEVTVQGRRFLAAEHEP